MMFKCCECGHLFEDGEQAVWEERHGLDTPPYEQWSGCPLCRGDYEKTKPCKLCESEHTPDELFGGVCDECINEYNYDIDLCYKIGEKSLDEIEINGFLATVFSKDEIEEILFQELRKAHIVKPVNCSEYIEIDKSWFAEMLIREVK